ncbi:RNA polymerase factor sigma-54, partial [Methylobacterium jeotgali]
MSLLQRLEMRQGQALVMTPQLLQAIKLLQLSQLDLAAYVDAELERNPLLERIEGEGPEAPSGEGPSEGSAEGDAFEADFDGEGEGWTAPEMNPGNGEIATDIDTRLDNVFAEEQPTSARAEEGVGDSLALTPPPYGGTGGSFDGEEPDFEASLTAETSLREHLATQLELATRDPVERLIGGFLIDAVDEAGYLREPLDGVAER